MKRGLQVIITLALGLLLGVAGMQGTAQSQRGERGSDRGGERGGSLTQSDSRPAQRGDDAPDIKNFNTLLVRHIFDPNRMYDTDYKAPVTTSTPVAPKIALNGVFIDKSEVVAIFEGTSPEYSVPVHVGGIIAGHKIVEIHPDRVLMSINDKPQEMMIAAKMIQDLKTKAWQITTDTTPLSGASYASSGYEDHGGSHYGGSDRYGSSRSYGSDRGSYGGSDRGGYSRYGGSDRGGYSRYGGSDRGSYGDRGGSSYGDRGSSRYGSDRGSFGDRGGSSSFGDRGGSSFGGSPSSGTPSTPGGTPGSAAGSTAVPAAPGAPAATPTPAPSSGASQDEIMRRLMERRQKETGQ